MIVIQIQLKSLQLSKKEKECSQKYYNDVWLIFNNVIKEIKSFLEIMQVENGWKGDLNMEVGFLYKCYNSLQCYIVVIDGINVCLLESLQLMDEQFIFV